MLLSKDILILLLHSVWKYLLTIFCMRQELRVWIFQRRFRKATEKNLAPVTLQFWWISVETPIYFAKSEIESTWYATMVLERISKWNVEVWFPYALPLQGMIISMQQIIEVFEFLRMRCNLIQHLFIYLVFWNHEIHSRLSFLLSSPARCQTILIHSSIIKSKRETLQFRKPTLEFKKPTLQSPTLNSQPS